jgi:F0F1-type ATP synthase assembly protein I
MGAAGEAAARGGGGDMVSGILGGLVIGSILDGIFD